MTRESAEPGCSGKGPAAPAKNPGAGPEAVGAQVCLRVADFYGGFLRGTWRWAREAQAESCHEPPHPGSSVGVAASSRRPDLPLVVLIIKGQTIRDTWQKPARVVLSLSSFFPKNAVNPQCLPPALPSGKW